MNMSINAIPVHNGWKLPITEEESTVVSDLSQAETQVRSYLDSFIPDVDHEKLSITITR